MTSPSAVWAENGTLGSYTSRAPRYDAPVAGTPSGRAVSVGAAVTICAATSSSGTA